MRFSISCAKVAVGAPCQVTFQQGFVLLKKRWVVERTFAWMMGTRRLVRDYELLPETSETFIYLAMIHKDFKPEDINWLFLFFDVAVF
jgi:hypothetical protein